MDKQLWVSIYPQRFEGIMDYENTTILRASLLWENRFVNYIDCFAVFAFCIWAVVSVNFAEYKSQQSPIKVINSSMNVSLLLHERGPTITRTVTDVSSQNKVGVPSNKPRCIEVEDLAYFLRAETYTKRRKQNSYRRGSIVYCSLL
jgi:hypothetical protein